MTTSTIEFVLSYIYLNNNIKKFDYLSKSYKIMSNMCYTKYFVIESILAGLDNPILPINSSEIRFTKDEYYLCLNYFQIKLFFKNNKSYFKFLK